MGVFLMKNCIVTGGAGYVGSHCCKELAKSGYNPITIDNLYRGHKELVKWGPFYECDILDREKLDLIFKKYAPKSVFHFAGLTYVGESVDSPDSYYRTNTMGTLSLLNAMKKYGCYNVVFSSTAATYGVPQYIPIDEEHPQMPINPYGRSKFFVEQILEDFNKAYGIKYAALRYFNASGADPECETGEMHDPETHLIPLVISAASGRKDCIKIFGNDYPTEDGTAIRDYIHVTDLASAHIKALELLIQGTEKIKLNLGTGKGYSVLDVIKMVETITGTTINTINEQKRQGDPPILIAKSDLAQKALKWKVFYSDLETIIRTALEWHEKL